MLPALQQPPDPLPAVFGRNRLTGPVGKGGIGAVSLACVPTGFSAEVRAVAELRHPNARHVYDLCELDGFHRRRSARGAGRFLEDCWPAVRARALELGTDALGAESGR